MTDYSIVPAIEALTATVRDLIHAQRLNTAVASLLVGKMNTSGNVVQVLEAYDPVATANRILKGE